MRLLDRQAVECFYDTLFLAPLIRDNLDETEKHSTVVCNGELVEDIILVLLVAFLRLCAKHQQV